MIKIDMHVHSKYSEDADGTLEEIINVLKKKGLNGVAITDHNSVEGGFRARQVAPKDFLVIPGVEISTQDGHLIALNVTENIPRDRSVDETVDIILDKGGLPIVPHLFRKMSGIKRPNLEYSLKKIPAIEVFNGCSLPKTNIKTAKIARALKLGGTGGSDSHSSAYVGYGYTVIPTTDLSIDSVLTELQKKTTWGEGTTMPLQYRKDRMMKSIKQFFQRGFKRI